MLLFQPATDLCEGHDIHYLHKEKRQGKTAEIGVPRFYYNTLVPSSAVSKTLNVHVQMRRLSRGRKVERMRLCLVRVRQNSDISVQPP